MDEEIITLSSDEDNESPKPSKITDLKSNYVSDCINFFKEKFKENMVSMRKNYKTEMKIFLTQGEYIDRPTPEVVDLVDCNDKSPKNYNHNDVRDDSKSKKHSETNGTDAKISLTCGNTPSNNNLVDKVASAEMPNDKISNLKEPFLKTEIIDKISPCKLPKISSQSSDEITIVENDMTEDNRNDICQDEEKKTCNKSFNNFKEFIDFCGSLEENPKHREKLIEKLNRYFAQAGPEYIRSKEFRALITKCKDKINPNNLYLVVKMIVDELKLQKNVQNRLKKKFAEINKNSQDEGENHSNSTFQKKKLAKVQKIMIKLNKLGCAIRELEKQEVDLSDEEDSVYLKLQRYRERFWVIYKKLCAYTGSVGVDRVFDEKIHFTETKYGAINKCIEKWLNKTKSFPDFADILKILESQSSELNLPSNKDSLRAMAVEIFQKVGDVLQRKRKYELWNSFSDFLEDTEDPVVANPELEKIFKENYEIRVKKEQEIYQHYTKRQEEESLQPKEVSEEEAYKSPESGNEEEEEIINIEKSLEKKLFQENGVTDQEKQRSDDECTPKNENVSLKEKESKNNFKNCKSLKWRSEKRTSKSESSDNSAAEMGGDNEEKTNLEAEDSELILMESDNQGADTKTVHRLGSLTSAVASPKKRSFPFGNENSSSKKKNLKNDGASNIVDLSEDGENVNITPIFDVGYCHIVTNHNFKERRKVFRDLTNLNRFMKKPELRDKMAGLFSPTFLYSRYSLKKETPWKKRFKIHLREIKPKNQKCALNEDEKTGEKISSTSSQDSKNKDSKDNADSGREGTDSSGQGNGQEEDNNDKGDENRKNGKVEEENDDHEEDDDEEKEDENAEAGEHSSDKQKTEKENEDSSESISHANQTLDDVEMLSVEDKKISEIEDTITEGTDQQKEEEEKEDEQEDGNLENSTDCVNFGRNTRSKSKDSEDVEEFENLKNSLEPICVLKEGDASDVIKKTTFLNPGMHYKSEEKEKLRTGPFTRNRSKMGMGKRSRNESNNQKRLPVTVAWTPPSEISQPKSRKMSASDEERVKRFLMHSPSSISITPPKKLTLSKPPSQSALQALETLRNLKGISATIVKGKPKREEVPLIGGQFKRPVDQSTAAAVKRRRPDLPVISKVQSVNTLTPKIVTVQGNVSGFENLWPEMTNNGNTNSVSSSIRISNVWGSLPESPMQGNPPQDPGCSTRKSNPGTSKQVRKKNPKKQVEYVVLD